MATIVTDSETQSNSRGSAAPEAVVEIDAEYIRGVAKLPDRLIILMDLQKILSLELREGGAA